MKSRRLWLTVVALGFAAMCQSTALAQGGWRGWDIHMADGTVLEANPLGMNEAGRFTRSMDPKQEGIERSKISYLSIGRRELPPLPEGKFKEDIVILEDGTRTFGAVTFRDLKFSEGIVIQNGKEISTEKIIYIKFAPPKKKTTKSKAGS
jgi:hypothetical protein